MKVSDKRRARRFPMTLPVAVRAEEAIAEQATVSTRDISSSGVYFNFDSELQVGTTLEFVLTLPQETTRGIPVQLKCMGKVVRVDRSANAGSVGIAATIERYEFMRKD